MKRYIVKMKVTVLMLLVVAGLSSLVLTSCASGGVGQASTNPAYYNPNSKTFPDTRWPFGNGGYR
jgi:hypothetical protein